ncbi:hypothetical protein N7455_003811 [Penicillium solitum]|uniref:uncharacterized protein n=1 Tax=Penicillium solitum TaxID=60172 RepID=UPI0032C4218A|nr:hypothetical protein N7536_012614 [Penicillium majusculum]KAJ5873268.1 hypothetical protein N7455_003811 [Penicillium solitum]
MAERRSAYRPCPTSRRQEHNPISSYEFPETGRPRWRPSDRAKLNLSTLEQTTFRKTISNAWQEAKHRRRLRSGGSPLSQPAHTRTYEAVIKELSTELDEHLAPDEASRHRQQHDPNKLDEGEGVSLFKICVRQVANAMMLSNSDLVICCRCFGLAMAVSFGIQPWIEGEVICAVIVLNIIVGFFQVYASEKTMELLHSLSSPTGTVSRGGQTFSVPSSEIVPGDMVELRTGDTVPADIRATAILKPSGQLCDWGAESNSRAFQGGSPLKRPSTSWGRKASTVEISHQLEAHGGSSQDFQKCGEVPDEPLRKDYFPGEPRSSLLSEALASVIGVGHLDGVDGDSNARRGKKIRRR